MVGIATRPANHTQQAAATEFSQAHILVALGSSIQVTNTGGAPFNHTHLLTVADSNHTQQSDGATYPTIVPDDSSFNQQSDPATLVQIHGLGVNEANHTQQADQSAVATHILLVNGANHAHQADPSIAHNLVALGSSHGHTAAALTTAIQSLEISKFVVGAVVGPENLNVSKFVVNVVLNGGFLNVNDSTHGHQAEMPNADSDGPFGTTTLVETSPDVLLVRARAWDTTVSRTVLGAPNACGSVAFAGGTSFTAGGQSTEMYLSDSGYTSHAADSPANTTWEARLISGFNFEMSLFRGDEPEGRSDVGRGEIVIANSDGFYDAAALLGFDGRTVEVWTGKKADPFSAFTKQFEGTAEHIEWTEGILTFKMRDRRFNADRSIGVVLYGGTGGLDGNSDVKGLPKPQTYGEQYNVRATLVNPASLIYQVHDRITSSIFAVRDKGVALTAAGDVTTVSILTATVSGGTYVTSLSTGLFKLGASPAGLITADVRGDAFGGYVSTTAAIVRRIVTTRLTGQQLADPEDLSAASFTALDASQPATIGIAVPPNSKTADVIDSLLIGIGGFWYFTRDGKFAVGRLEAPTDLVSTRAITKTEISEANPIRRVGPIPSWRRRVSWRQLGVAQSPDVLASSVSDTDRAFYSQLARFSEASDSSIRTGHKLAQDKVTGGLFTDSDDADTEAVRVLSLHKTLRDFYEVGVVDSLFEFDLAQIVTLTHPRWDLTSGKKFIVVNISEIHELNETVLTLWG